MSSNSLTELGNSSKIEFEFELEMLRHILWQLCVRVVSSNVLLALQIP